MAPQQKPGRSRQDYQTPPEFLDACKSRIGETFGWDLAADASNSVAGEDFYGEKHDALKQDWAWISNSLNYWAWCNPSYANIRPWVKKAWEESRTGARVAMLVPSSTGSNWWRDWVEGKAYITYLNGRLTFVGQPTCYPKDLALLIYAPYLEGGSCIWNWRK